MYTLSGSGEAFIDGICCGGTSCGCSGRAGNSGGDPRPSSSGAAQCASKMRCDSAAFSSGSAVLSTRHAHSASVVGSSTASAAAALAAAPCAHYYSCIFSSSQNHIILILHTKPVGLYLLTAQLAPAPPPVNPTRPPFWQAGPRRHRDGSSRLRLPVIPCDPFVKHYPAAGAGTGCGCAVEELSPRWSRAQTAGAAPECCAGESELCRLQMPKQASKTRQHARWRDRRWSAMRG